MEMQPLETGCLYVRDGKRRYQQASAEAIMAAARSVVNTRSQRGISFMDPLTARHFFRDRLAGYEREVFAVVFLDTRHRLIDYAEMFLGTIDSAEVHPREVARLALRHNASAVIVAHNHPSGATDPSAADRTVTARLKQALSLVDVRLLDHIVVGGSETVSMAGRGLV